MRILAALAAVLALAGCGSLADPLPVGSPRPAAPVDVVVEPAAVRIPRIDVASTLIRTAWQDEPGGELEVPPVTEPWQASWFAEGGIPGEAGYPAVILGHVSGRPPGADRSIPGVFARLDELTPGDAVVVERVDGVEIVFVVTAVREYCKSEADILAGRCRGAPFDEEAVYGDTPNAAIRLITCGGEYDARNREYRKNIVVFADLVL